MKSIQHVNKNVEFALLLLKKHGKLRARARVFTMQHKNYYVVIDRTYSIRDTRIILK